MADDVVEEKTEEATETDSEVSEPEADSGAATTA